MYYWQLIPLFIFSMSLTKAHCIEHKMPIDMETYSREVGEVNQDRQNITTLNKMGSAYCFTTELTDRFLEYCLENPDSQVLEIGCAYGIKSSQIVQTGVHLVANDIDEDHLKIMQLAFANFSKSNPQFANVDFFQGNIVNLPLECFNGAKFDAILIESVLHFLTPDEIQITLGKLNDLLKDNGRVYILTSSPYLKYLYDQYVINIELGQSWPGFFEDPQSISEGAARLRKPYHCLDEQTLGDALVATGFEIMDSKYISRPHHERDLAMDGREGLMMIAKKLK